MLEVLLHIVSWTLVATIFFLIGFLSIELVTGCLSRKQGSKNISSVPVKKVAILIPAHNEEAVLNETLLKIKEQICQLKYEIEVVVVADNCTDRTAEIAKVFDFVTTLKRTNHELRGKGYALDYGMQYLKDGEPDIVVIHDADCHFVGNSLSDLVAKTAELNKPVQSTYLIANKNSSAGFAMKIAEFAFLVKNKVRPRGARRLRLPTHLFGSGMAFPCHILQNVDLANGHIVEDMKLGVELVKEGNGAVYFEQALMLSYFPDDKKAQNTQRERWEHGHLDTIKTFVPGLLYSFLKKPKWYILGFALDLMIPPLVLTIFVSLVCLAFLAVVSLFISSYAFIAALSIFTIFAIAMAFTYIRFGRSIVTPAELMLVPVYLFKKVGVYKKFFKGQKSAWVRTKRDDE